MRQFRLDFHRQGAAGETSVKIINKGQIFEADNGLDGLSEEEIAAFSAADPMSKTIAIDEALTQFCGNNPDQLRAVIQQLAQGGVVFFMHSMPSVMKLGHGSEHAAVRYQLEKDDAGNVLLKAKTPESTKEVSFSVSCTIHPDGSVVYTDLDYTPHIARAAA